jgi:predicted DNA-binding antitoxin AbrB/MazE fold protein
MVLNSSQVIREQEYIKQRDLTFPNGTLIRAGFQQFLYIILIRDPYAGWQDLMSRAIECIYENNVLKPLGRVPLRDGERIRIRIEEKLSFEPIRLKKKPSLGKIRSLRDDAWTSSWIPRLSSA